MEYLDAIEVTTGENPAASVIWLHGLGASGHDFEPIVPHLGLPESTPVRFVFPHAPNIPVTVNGGMVMPAWYDLLSLDLERKLDQNQLLDSAERTADLVRREMDRGVDSRRIVVAGFSQGGAVAYQTALTFEEPLGGLMTMSTYFATADSITPSDANRELPIHVFHGTGDPMVPEQLGTEAVKKLTDLGYAPQYKTYPMGHEVCMEEVRDIGEWLRSVL
jgi:phospholipase/carboxylesterase